MTAQGKANYEGYRKVAGRPGVSAAPLPEYEQLPMELAYAFDAGADAVEEWLADAPVDEDMPGGDRSLAGLMPMGLHFDDADPVARCLVKGCQWHGHGDSMNDAVTAWTAHLAKDHRRDWPEDDQ